MAVKKIGVYVQSLRQKRDALCVYGQAATRQMSASTGRQAARLENQSKAGSLKGVIKMSFVSSLIGTLLKAAFNNLGAKKTAELVTSKPVREVGKKIIKHEIKKRLK